MFERLWFWNLAPYTGWTFFTFICCKNCIVSLERPKINEKESGIGTFLNTSFNYDRPSLQARVVWYGSWQRYANFWSIVEVNQWYRLPLTFNDRMFECHWKKMKLNKKEDDKGILKRLKSCYLWFSFSHDQGRLNRTGKISCTVH